MSKDAEWEARHQEGQISIEKARIAAAKKEGRFCPHCNKIIDRKYIITETEENLHETPSVIGDGDTVIGEIYDVVKIKCPDCGWEHEFRRTKRKN